MQICFHIIDNYERLLKYERKYTFNNNCLVNLVFIIIIYYYSDKSDFVHVESFCNAIDFREKKKNNETKFGRADIKYVNAPKRSGYKITIVPLL